MVLLLSDGRWIAPDLDAIAVGIPEVDGLSMATSAPPPTRSVLDGHAVLGEVLLERLEVGRVDHHREMVQVLKARTPAQRFPWLHGEEVDHGVLADPHGGKSDLAPAEFVQPLGLE